MRRINFKFLLILIVIAAVLGGALIGINRLQKARNSGGKLELARERVEEGKIAEALPLYAQYVALQPGDDTAFAEYSKLLLARATAPDATRNDIARAYNSLETAVLRKPDDDDLRLQLAQFQLRVGRPSDAREHLLVLEERVNSPDYEPPTDAAKPDLTAEEGEADDESEGADPADLAVTPQRVRLLLASAQLASGEYDEAARIVSGLVGYNLDERKFIEPDAEQGDDGDDQPGAETDAFILLAAILQERLEEPESAQTILEELVKRKSEEPRAWLAMTSWYRERGDLEAAAKAVDKAVELGGDDPSCVFAAFEMALAEKDAERAMEIAKRAAELFPNDERSYRGLAAVTIQAGDLAEAENVLLEGVERLPGKASLLMMLTDVFLQQGKVDEASNAINRIRDLYGTGSGPVGLLEARLLVAERRWNEAKAKLEQVRPLVLGNNELIRQVDLYLGQCHAQLDEYDAQLEVNRRILNDDPGSLAARAGAAQALISAGKAEQALAEFEAIAAAIPSDRLVRTPQVWYPLLQLRINHQSSLPETERDWNGIDSLLNALEINAAVSPEQLALLRSETLVRRGELAAARDLLTATAETTGNPQIWAGLLTLALRVEGPAAAEATLARVPEAIRGVPSILLMEAQIASQKPFQEAEGSLEQIVARAADLPTEETVRVLRAVAPIYLAAGQPAKAEQLWQEASVKMPRDLGIHEALLELAVVTKDLPKARKAAADIAAIAGQGSARGRVAQATVTLLEARLALAAAQEEDKTLQKMPPAVDELIDQARNYLVEAENDRPGWGQIQLLFADIDSLRGNPSGAVDRLRRAIASGPVNPPIVRRLASLLYSLNRLEEAQQAMTMLGEDGGAGLERISAELKLRSGELDEAAALAEQSIPGDTQNPEDLLWLGQILARCGKTDRASAVLGRATELVPDNPEIWLALFTHQANSGIPEAADALEKAASLMPEPRRQLALAQGYEMLNRPADAERVLREAVAGWPNDAEAIRGLASFQLRRGQRKEAEDLLRKILAGDDAVAVATKPWARRALAESIASQGTYREFLGALELLRQNTAPDGTVADADLDLEIQLLSARPEPASWQRAVDLINTLEERRPLTTGRRLTRAQLHEKLGQWAASRDELVVLVAKPETPPAYVALLIEKLIEHGETSSARTWLRRLEQSAPESVLTLALHAKLAMAENNREEAIEYARQLMPGQEVAGDQPSQLNAVATLMEDLGFAKAADRVFEQYAAVSSEGVRGRIRFLGRQGRSDEALDLIEEQWDAFSLERALTLAIEVIRSQPDDAALAAAAGRVSTWIEKGKRVDPGSIVIKLLDAELLTLQGREAEAEAMYRQLLDRKDLSTAQAAIVANNLAFQLATQETATEASGLIDKAIDELGPLPDLLDTRGIVRLAQLDAAGALEDLRLAVLSPSAAKFLHLAAAELAAGNDAAAREALEKARESGLARLRLPAADVARLEELERKLGPAAGSTAATAG